MPTMRRVLKTISPRTRRLLAVPSLLAVVIAGGIVTANDNTSNRSLTPGLLPGATAEPTGPGGPTGPGSPGMPGGQFQPPGMPSAPSGYGGGSYPGPNQSNGIDINNSAEQLAPQQNPEASNPAQQPRQQPVNGTQPPDYDRVPERTAPPTPEQQQPSTQSAPTQSAQPRESGAPTPSAPSTVERTAQRPRDEQGSQQEQNSSRDNYRCLNTSSAVKYFSARGPVTIELVDGTGCDNCDFEKPRENPNNCSSSYSTGVAVRPATPGAEGGLESIMIFYTQKARVSGMGSGIAILAAGTPEQLAEFPAKIAQGAEDAAQMWTEVMCHAQASQIRSPSDVTKTVYDRLAENRDSTFQQFLCHFYGAPKKVYDGPGGINKPSWNVEWARAAKGTAEFVFQRHPCN